MTKSAVYIYKSQSRAGFDSKSKVICVLDEVFTYIVLIICSHMKRLVSLKKLFGNMYTIISFSTLFVAINQSIDCIYVLSLFFIKPDSIYPHLDSVPLGCCLC